MSRKFILVVGIVLLMVSMIYQSGMLNVISSAQTEVNVSVNPGSLNVAPNDIFNLSISIANTQDVARWMLSLQWNASILELFPVPSQALTEGSFMGKNGTTFFHPPLNQGPGMISSVSCDFRPPSRANGDGILFNASFRAIGQGITDIAIYACVLTSSSMVRTIPITNKGRVSVSQLAHYVKVSLDPIGYVFANEKTVVVASVKNLGTEDEYNFNMRILINNAIANSSHLDRLNTGSSYELSYEWTPIVSESYTIIGDVDSLPNQTRIENASAMVTVEPETHALSVSLNCPAQAYVNQTVLLNTTVTNQGALYEANVNLTMAIRGASETKFPLVIPLSVKGSNSSISTPWRFTNSGNYDINVTIDETLNDPSNKSATTTVAIVEQIGPTKTDILIVSDDGGYYKQYGTSLEEFKTALDAAGSSYDVYVESVSGPILSVSTLSPYKLVIWTCGDFAQWVIDPREELTLLAYFRAGGSVLLEGEKVVSDLISRNQHTLVDEMLHVKWDKFAVITSGVEPIYPHPLMQGLTTASWVKTPTYYPDGVEAIQGGFAVMNYEATNFSAVTAVDGSETGTGSVVYLSFSVSCLSEPSRTILIQNTIQWFNRFGVSVVLGEIIRSPSQSVSFGYGDLQRNNGWGYDEVAGGMLYSLCQNEQIQEFADAQYASKPNGTLIVAFGSPFDNEAIKHMNTSRVLPIIICQDSNDPNHYQFRNSTSNALLYDFKTGSGKSSLFIIEAFKKDDTTYLVVSGLDWQGMWASGMKLSRTICRNLRDYGGSYYIFEWRNSNETSIPRPDDYQMQQTLSTIH